MAAAIELDVVMEQDAESGWFTVTCPALKGCVSQGQTEDEALENIKEAILLWLEVDIEQHAAKIAQEAASQVINRMAMTRRLTLSF